MLLTSHDESGRRIGAYVLACFVAGTTGIVVGFGPYIVRDWGRGTEHGGSTLFAILFMAGAASVATFLLAALPSFAFLRLAHRRGWRDPATYLLFGCGLVVLFVLLFVGSSPGSGDTLLGFGLILGGGLAGLVYWSMAVRPVGQAGTSGSS